MLRVTCPECQKSFKIPDDQNGNKMECPKCKKRFRASGTKVTAGDPKLAERGLMILGVSVVCLLIGYFTAEKDYEQGKKDGKAALVEVRLTWNSPFTWVGGIGALIGAGMFIAGKKASL
jgi:predicted Zn finger-like uncharacterized protein